MRLLSESDDEDVYLPMLTNNDNDPILSSSIIETGIASINLSNKRYYYINSKNEARHLKEISTLRTLNNNYKKNLTLHGTKLNNLNKCNTHNNTLNNTLIKLLSQTSKRNKRTLRKRISVKPNICIDKSDFVNKENKVNRNSFSNKHKLSLDDQFSKKETKKRKIISVNRESTENNMSMYDYHQRPRIDDICGGNNGGNFSIGYNIPSKTNEENAIANHNNHYYIPSSHLSMATLCNIGNTCYLNSVIYTLRFAPIFLHNLHHLVEDLSQITQKISNSKIKSSSLGRNVGGLVGQSARSWSNKDLASLGNNLNCDIPKTNRQIATEKLHELYQNLHRNEMTENSDPFHADTFLHAIQDVSSIFEGNQQQDAHEFLMCILDSIRETCQSLTKIIIDTPEIIMNGYVSVPEQSEMPPLPISTSTSQKTSFFSRKLKKKDEKNKIPKPPDSPLKEPNSAVETTVNGTIPNTSTNQLFTSGTSIAATTNGTSEIDAATSPNNDKEKINEKIKKLGLDFFSEDFEGVTVSTTKCLSCETITEQKESMIDIAVPILNYENLDKIDNPDLFFQNSIITREYFSGDNKYRCEQCSGYTEAIRSISFEVLPRLLIIQLKRFSGGMEKINSYIPTPFKLNCFCTKCINKTSDSAKLHTYKLYSVITHVGATMSVGHYIAYTCSLDIFKEYFNCPKDLNKKQQNSRGQAQITSNQNNTSNEKNSGRIKKIMFGRNKASSSGDVTKNIKNNINGVMNKIVNSGEKLISASSSSSSSSSTTTPPPATICQGIKCCGIHSEAILLRNNGSNLSNGVSAAVINCNSGDDFPDSNYGNSNNHHHHNGIGDNNLYNQGGSSNRHHDPLWYMCDDDKIKSMTQNDFEDLLSPNNKVTITPYILFYARINNNE